MTDMRTATSIDALVPPNTSRATQRPASSSSARNGCFPEEIPDRRLVLIRSRPISTLPPACILYDVDGHQLLDFAFNNSSLILRPRPSGRCRRHPCASGARHCVQPAD